MLRHAPVTTACLGIVVVTTTALSHSLLATLLHSGPGVVASLLIHVPLSMFPVFPYAPSGWTFVCLLLFLFHCRQLERQWGSPRMFTFISVMSLIGRLAAQLVVSGSSASANATRAAYLLAALVPLAALMTRHLTDIPAVGRTSLFSGRLCVSEKIFVLAAAVMVVVFSPDPPAFLHERHAARVQHVSVWSRALLAASGVLLGYLTRGGRFERARRDRVSTSLAAQFFNAITNNISRPIVRNVLAPLMSPLAGPATCAEQCLPPRLQQQHGRVHGNGVQAAGGRGVGALAGDGSGDIPSDVWARIIREQQELNSAHTPLSPGSNARRQFPVPANATTAAGGRSEASAARHHLPLDEAKAQLLRDLQLGAPDELIAEALEVSGGDVDAAAAYLLSHSSAS